MICYASDQPCLLLVTSCAQHQTFLFNRFLGQFHLCYVVASSPEDYKDRPHTPDTEFSSKRRKRAKGMRVRV